MNDTDDKTDLNFRKLFGRTGLESPSSGFTENVMNQITGLGEEADIPEEKSLIRRWAGYGGISLLVLLGLSIMYYFGVDILPDSFKPFLSPGFSSVFSSFKGIFDSIEISGTTIAIILGFAFLVILERVLSRHRASKNFYLSF